MKAIQRMLLVLLALLALTACGGGGGGSSSLVYDGVTTQATITGENAADLAALAYYGSQLNDPLPLSVAPMPEVASGTAVPVLQEVASTVSQLPGQIDVASLGGTAVRVTTSIPAFTEPCEVSGSMTISGTFDNELGTINAKIVFNSCNSGEDVILNGSIGLNASGITDPYDPEFVDYTVDFRKLSYQFIEDGQEIVLDGTAVGSMDSATSTMLMTLNMVMQDSVTGQMVKLVDYKISIVENLDYSQEVTISGQIYESTSGYFNVVTLSPILVDTYGDPYEGVYRIDGANSTWAKVDFSITTGAQGSYGEGETELGIFFL